MGLWRWRRALQAFLCRRTHTHTHTHTITHTPSHTHAPSHTHTHTHTHAPSHTPSCSTPASTSTFGPRRNTPGPMDVSFPLACFGPVVPVAGPERCCAGAKSGLVFGASCAQLLHWTGISPYGWRRGASASEDRRIMFLSAHEIGGVGRWSPCACGAAGEDSSVQFSSTVRHGARAHSD